MRPTIIGIGAPIHLYLADAARLLETEAVIPPHADVANAIGAITGGVVIHHQIEIEPTEQGRYRVSGLPDTPTFADFDQCIDMPWNGWSPLCGVRPQTPGRASHVSRCWCMTEWLHRATADRSSSVAYSPHGSPVARI